MPKLFNLFLIIGFLFSPLRSKLCRNPSEFQALVPNYNSSIHKIISKDGYNLVAFQILPNISNHLNSEKILILHGLGDSPDSFAIEENSIVFYLLDKGYEVWLGSNRGTKYSCTHQTLDNTSEEFWDYSWQEMGAYDVPSFVDTVIEVTGVNQVTIIGHSQGTTQTFAALSDIPTLQNKVKQFIALAPVLFMERDPESPNLWTIMGKMNVLKLLSDLNIVSLPFVDINEYMLIKPIVYLACVKTKFLCKLMMKLLFSKNPDLINYEKVPQYFDRAPGGCSVKSFRHYSQLMFSANVTFHKFNYDEQENWKKYGQKDAPIYDISKIKIPVKAFYGGNDQLCSLKNMSFIIENVKNIKTYFMDEWGHVEYLWASDKSIMYKGFDEIF
jgi:pimeloyl-ACP methyl ester carboxylesterase